MGPVRHGLAKLSCFCHERSSFLSSSLQTLFLFYLYVQRAVQKVKIQLELVYSINSCSACSTVCSSQCYLLRKFELQFIHSVSFLVVMTGVSRYLLLECPSRRLQLLILSSFSIFNIVSSSGCYYAYNTTILSSPDYVDPCGPITSTTSSFLNCCALQSNNICLSNSICYDPNPIGGAYYLSPCTDKTYSAPECPQYCSMFRSNFIFLPHSNIP